MGILNYIKEKKEKFRTKRLEIATNKAKVMEERAEKHAKELEKLKEHNKAYVSAMNRQAEAKAVIQEARRLEHPLLYKIGDSVKQKFAEAHKNKTSSRFASQKNNIFSQSKSEPPYWLKQNKGNDLFGNNSSSHNIFTKTSTPYWLKKGKR